MMTTENFDILSLIPFPEKLRGKEKKLREVQDYVRENPGKYDSKIIAKMKQIGMKRPEWIPKEEWTPKRKQHDSRGELIARLAAAGMRAGEIARRTGGSEVNIAEWLKNPEIKKRINQLQDDMFGGNPKTLFKTALNEAFNTQLEIMRKETVKDSVRLNAAQDFMDRAAGKAQQDVNINDSSIRTLIERLDKIERSGGLKAIEVTPENITDAETIEVGDNREEPLQVTHTDAEPLDPVDKWLKESGFCQNGSTGKNP